MASFSMAQNGHNDHILRPRAVKASGLQVSRPQGDKSLLQAGEEIPSSVSSGRSTPIPFDAPPSVQSISSARKQIRAQQKQRIFPTVDYTARVSHFDPDSEHQDFRGFFALFWVGLAIMVITTGLRNVKDTGFPIRGSIWTLLVTKVWQLALVDFGMVATTAISLPLHKLYRSNGWVAWKNGGMAIQSTYQLCWSVLWLGLPFYLQWTWTAQVFLTLHTMTLFMKMHSYAFYCGHLCETERRLSGLDHPEGESKASAYRYPHASSRLDEKDRAKNHEQIDPADQLSTLREDLATELTSPLGRVTYPQNLTIANFIDYLFCPTLCYELEYPRTERIRPFEVFAKSLAVFGVIFLMINISEEFILPVLQAAKVQIEDSTSTVDRLLVVAEATSNTLFPFMISFLLTFLVIFEYVLGALAEITRFADRRFFADWWNSVDWLEFSREWNIPVHHFFRRHVYSASRPHLSKPLAYFVTFLISSLAHEIIMACMTKKMRGYGFGAMMLQLPIVMLQRTKWVRQRKTFNNVCFWCSMVLGISMICALYVLC